MKGTLMIARNAQMSIFTLRQRRKHRDIRAMNIGAAQAGGAV